MPQTLHSPRQEMFFLFPNTLPLYRDLSPRLFAVQSNLESYEETTPAAGCWDDFRNEIIEVINVLSLLVIIGKPVTKYLKFISTIYLS